MSLTKLRFALVAFAASLLTLTEAQAALVQISGMSTGPFLAPTTVTFDYDPTLADTDPDPVRGAFLQEGLLTVTAGDFFSSAPLVTPPLEPLPPEAPQVRALRTSPSSPPPFGSLSVSARDPDAGVGPLGDPIFRSGSLLFFFDEPFDLNALPSLAQLSAADSVFLTIADEFMTELGFDTIILLSATLDPSSIALVPLPAGLPLLAAALVGLGIARRRSRSL